MPVLTQGGFKVPTRAEGPDMCAYEPTTSFERRYEFRLYLRDGLAVSPVVEHETIAPDDRDTAVIGLRVRCWLACAFGTGTYRVHVRARQLIGGVVGNNDRRGRPPGKGYWLDVTLQATEVNQCRDEMARKRKFSPDYQYLYELIPR